MEIYRDRQWLVTPHGIEGISDELRYWIPLGRILETTERNGITYYEWLAHISEKECVRIHPFIKAFVAALRFYVSRAGVKIDDDLLARSLDYAMAYNIFAIKD